MAVILDLEPQETPIRTYAGQVIYQHRLAAGRTVQSVATAVGHSQPYLTQIEVGSRMAPRETLLEIAAELDIERWIMYSAYMRDLEAAEQRAWMGPQP